MNGRSTAHYDPWRDRDRVATELKRRLHMARCARNKIEERRIVKQLKFWGIPA